MLVAMVLVFTVQGNVARAEYWDGNKLHEFCQKSIETIQQSYCLAYVAGIHDALGSVQMFCVPNFVQLRQLTDVTKQFLVAHPERRHQAASMLVTEALAEAFPCK